jgi:uncharacterized membrane protein
MLDQAVFALVFAAAIGSGVVGGILYAFSSFVMKALGRLPTEQGAAAMNHINVTVITPSFMMAFMGTAFVSAVLVVASYFWWDQWSGKLMLVASLIYLVGNIGVTMACNVPLNNQLAAVSSHKQVELWLHYQNIWTMWNHVRTVASIISAIVFMGCRRRLKVDPPCRLNIDPGRVAAF